MGNQIKKQAEMQIHAMTFATDHNHNNVCHLPSAPTLQEEEETNVFEVEQNTFCIICCESKQTLN